MMMRMMMICLNKKKPETKKRKNKEKKERDRNDFSQRLSIIFYILIYIFADFNLNAFGNIY